MNLQTASFRFNALLKRTPNLKLEALELFPNLAEIVFTSRVFPTYAECVNSSKLLMEDVCKNINENSGDQKFKVGAEVNPIHSGARAMSTDWTEDEIARFWVYDQAQEGTTTRLEAVCKSSIFAVPREDQTTVPH